MRPVAFDFETYLIAPGRLAPRPVCMSYQEGDEAPKLLTAHDGLNTLACLLARPDNVLVGANTAYDIGVALEARPELLELVVDAYEQDRVLDVQIIEQLNLISRGDLKFDRRIMRPPDLTLAGLTHKYTGVKLDGKKEPDAWRYRYHELDGVPLDQWPEAATNYALFDSVATMRVFVQQGGLDDLPPTAGDQMRADMALHAMGAWGVRTNRQSVEKFKASLKARLDAARVDLQRVGFIRQDGTEDQKAIRARVETAYGALGQAPPRSPPSKTHPMGQVKIDADTLEQSGDDDLELLASISQDQTEWAQWIPVLERGITHPINPRWNVLVESDRTSCSKPTLQNPPRREGVRDCFEPRPGNVFVSVDWNAAELRALAQIIIDMYGHSSLAEAFRQDLDPHLAMGANILGISYEEAHARRKEPEIQDARQLAKAPNFGFPGGLGAESFVDFARSSGVDLTPAEYASAPKSVRREAAVARAKELKTVWLRTWPEMARYFQDLGRLTESGDYQYRLARTGFVRGGLRFTNACNHGFQSIVAHAGKRALWRVFVESYLGRWEGAGTSPLFGFRPVLFLHDEIIGEAPERHADAMGRRLAHVMVESLQHYCPDVPITAEPALMRRWYKGAKTVFDADGKLIPWEPKEK